MGKSKFKKQVGLGFMSVKREGAAAISDAETKKALVK
jgi:hypothetical protein